VHCAPSSGRAGPVSSVPKIACEVCGRTLAALTLEQGKALAAEAVVPVPLLASGKASVGTQISGEEARLPYRAILLMRTRARLDKRILPPGRKSVRGAFATRPGSQVDNLRVLLVHDVLWYWSDARCL
jgi:predicted amidophosphoribosyltransferase